MDQIEAPKTASALAPGTDIDYFVVQAFADQHRLSYNETAAMVRAAIAVAAPAKVAPVALNLPVTETDIASAREHIADVHNAEQLRSALSQLRREVVIEMAARELVPSFYGDLTPLVDAASSPTAQTGEDPALLDFLIDNRAYVANAPGSIDGYWLQFQTEDGDAWVQPTEHATPRDAIRAARAQQGGSA